MTQINDFKEFLDNLKAALNLKTAALVSDRDGFYLLISSNDKFKEVRFGNLDLTKDMNKDVFEEIKSLVEAQGW